MRSELIQKRIIDAIGSAMVMACAVGFFWSIASGSELTRGEIARLKQVIKKNANDVNVLEDQQTKLKAIVAQRREALKESGRLPDRAPVEDYFQELSTLAGRHGVHVIRHHPFSERSYPGLLEQRFLYEVAGTTEGIVRFLQSIEQSDYWADVSYLAIDAQSRAATADAMRKATLTISLFSAPPDMPSKTKPGGP